MKKRTLRRFVILPTCLVVFDAFEEVVVYKLSVISNPFWRTGAILGMYLCGFSVAALLLSPLLENWLETIYATGRRQAGRLGAGVWLLLLALLLYGLYYRIYIDGPASVLPPGWRNPPQAARSHAGENARVASTGGGTRNALRPGVLRQESATGSRRGPSVAPPRLERPEWLTHYDKVFAGRYTRNAGSPTRA